MAGKAGSPKTAGNSDVYRVLLGYTHSISYSTLRGSWYAQGRSPPNPTRSRLLQF